MDIITYLLTPWSRVLLEKLTGFAASQEIPRILWNPKVHYMDIITQNGIMNCLPFEECLCVQVIA